MHRACRSVLAFVLTFGAFESFGLRGIDQHRSCNGHSEPSALRAAGTIGQPAIRFILEQTNSSELPLFSEVKSDMQHILSSSAIAGSIVDSATQQAFIVFNPRYQSENPFLLS